MKVLLDEDLPHKLRASLSKHDVFTTAYLGWSGLKNGELLRAADEAAFEVFITGDKKLSDQQNLKRYRLAVVCFLRKIGPLCAYTLKESTPRSMRRILDPFNL